MAILDFLPKASLGAVSALVAYHVISTIRSWWKLRRFKGPWLAAFSYLWLAQTAASGKAWKIHLDARKKYGSLVRVGPNTLINDDPEVFKHMHSARSRYTRGQWYSAMRFDPYVHN